MKYKAFTLIELLVVIAVIGLLSSIVIVNLTGTRSKANVARGLQFSQSVHNALGSEAVGVWSFDEGSGTIANDSSGYDNNGTLVNFNFNENSGWTTDSPSGRGYTLKFDGADDYIQVEYDEILNPPVFTISLWAKVMGNQNTWRTAIMSRSGTPRQGYNIYAGSDNKWQFWVGGNDSWQSITGGNVIIGEWIHLTAVYNGGQMIFYHNGNLASGPSSRPYNANTSSNLYLGSGGGTYFFNGLIDDVRVYAQALTLSQIQQLYAETAPKYRLVLE
jgi:prepilin-type N-terminal cleavage/methylation domain-containing protein